MVIFYGDTVAHGNLGRNNRWELGCHLSLERPLPLKVYYCSIRTSLPETGRPTEKQKFFFRVISRIYRTEVAGIPVGELFLFHDVNTLNICKQL